MGTYITRRLLLVPPTLLIVSVFIFLVLRVVPGDVAHTILAGREGATALRPEDLAKLRTQLGLDRPLAVQYFSWISGLARLDLGDSLFHGEPVIQEFKRRFPVTLELAVLTLLISLSIGIPLGVLMAIKQDTMTDYGLRIVSILGIAMPGFWIGSLVILFLSLVLHWIPPIGYVSLWKDPWSNFQQLIFPALVLGYLLSALTARMTRSTMLEVLREDYVRTARAKGLRESVVIGRHALKNALLPVITIVGSQFGHLLGGTLIMEALFSIPGMGNALISALNERDYPIVENFLVIMVLWFLLINLAVDVAYAQLDPRIRFN
ncbi:MAG: ABC transporter permease [Chloroflexi bacterium]|nr:ABC transporter permease [Chloroflexota bacterium]